MNQDETRRQRIQTLLDDLNHLERHYGRVPAEADPRYEPTGEVNARVQVLKGELADLGVRLRWSGERYVIEGDGA